MEIAKVIFESYFCRLEISPDYRAHQTSDSYRQTTGNYSKPVDRIFFALYGLNSTMGNPGRLYRNSSGRRVASHFQAFSVFLTSPNDTKY